jgi:hypothetical protein
MKSSSVNILASLLLVRSKANILDLCADLNSLSRVELGKFIDELQSNLDEQLGRIQQPVSMPPKKAKGRKANPLSVVSDILQKTGLSDAQIRGILRQQLTTDLNTQVNIPEDEAELDEWLAVLMKEVGSSALMSAAIAINAQSAKGRN